jgi:hypothetical protein
MKRLLCGVDGAGEDVGLVGVVDPRGRGRVVRELIGIGRQAQAGPRGTTFRAERIRAVLRLGANAGDQLVVPLELVGERPAG